MMHAVNALQTLIVDDEPLNREELRYALKPYERIEVVAEAENVAEALAALEQYSIDLVLLDIEMEESPSGLRLAKEIARQTPRPYIIFVTAHEKYSLQSFDYEPLHYLTKPLNDKKLAQGLERAFTRVKPSRITIKYCKEEDGEIIRPTTYIDVKRILYIQTEKFANTITIYLEDGIILKGVRQTLKQFQQRLHPKKFKRSHSSFIVNLRCVKELRPRKPNDDNYCLILKEVAEPIPVSKSRLASIRNLLERL